jgi:hypothetical protein
VVLLHRLGGDHLMRKQFAVCGQARADDHGMVVGCVGAGGAIQICHSVTCRVTPVEISRILHRVRREGPKTASELRLYPCAILGLK